MKQLKVTPRQAQVLDALCEFGQTDLVAYKLKLKPHTVEQHIYRLMQINGYPNRLTLVLAWDREKRNERT